jgi:ornithine cyclodeaminase
MLIMELPEIRRTLAYPEVIARMRDALIANSRGECDTPMPMHLDIQPEQGEVHIKSSYRRGGRYFALKIASTFPGNVTRGLPTGNGMMMLCSAETGEPLALLADAGHLTDVRTAAAAAMVAHELKSQDQAMGILGTGVQARLQVQMHAHVLDLVQLWIWGRTPKRVAECKRDLERLLPHTEIFTAASPAEVARQTRLIVTCTASREPLLSATDLQPGTLISAVGSDSPGKQELDPSILRRAALILVDSQRQCEKLGELQHAPSEWQRAVEIGAFLDGESVPMPTPPPDADAAWFSKSGPITVCDFTGLGVEDLYIAEYCYERSAS